MASIELMEGSFVSLVQDHGSLKSDMSTGEVWEKTRSTLTQKENVSFSGSQHASKSRISNEEWELAKPEIEQIYLDEDCTLSAAMTLIGMKYGIKASERKWKLKLKEWGFEKYVPATTMKILVAKAERRARVENKETVFFHGKTRIASERIDLFKKRKAFREGPAVSPSRQTPSNCSYRTPSVNPADVTPLASGTLYQHGGILQGGHKRYACRFLETLGCEKTFVTRDHALRHSKIHKGATGVSCCWPPRHNTSTQQDNVDQMLGRDRDANLWKDDLILYAESGVPTNSSINKVRHCNLPDVWLSTIVNCLLDYVRRFAKIVSGLPGEINHLCAECLSVIATSITRELLSIINFCRNLNPACDGLYQAVKLSVADNNVAGVNRTKTYRTLFEHTVRLLFANCRRSQLSPEVSLIAFELLESIFQQKLVPSKRPLHFSRLGQSYEDRRDYDAAETCYRLAIKLYVESNDFGDFFGTEGNGLLKCRKHFGDFLMEMNMDDEALIMLIHAFTTCVSDCMLFITNQDSFHEPTSWDLFLFDLPSSSFHDIASSLQRLHLKMDQGSFAWVRSSVSRLQNLDLNSDTCDGEEILLEFMKLGAAYSHIWLFDAANVVYEFATPRLKSFNSRSHAFERACAFSEAARHYEKLGSSDELSKQLQLAFRCIEEIRRYTDSNAAEPGTLLEPSDKQSGKVLPGPGPLEEYFEGLAREDPQLSRWMRGDDFERRPLFNYAGLSSIEVA